MYKVFEKIEKEFGLKLALNGSYKDRKAGGKEFGKPMDELTIQKLGGYLYPVLQDLNKKFKLHFKQYNIAVLARNTDSVNTLGLACAQSGAMAFSTQILHADENPISIRNSEFNSPSESTQIKALRMVACKNLIGQRISKRKAIKYTCSIIRHEIGHILTTDKQLKLISPYLANSKSRELFTKYISEYGSSDKYEAIAEVFALVTDPDYNKGDVCSELENMVYDMISDFTA